MWYLAKRILLKTFFFCLIVAELLLTSVFMDFLFFFIYQWCYSCPLCGGGCTLFSTKTPLTSVNKHGDGARWTCHGAPGHNWSAGSLDGVTSYINDGSCIQVSQHQWGRVEKEEAVLPYIQLLSKVLPKKKNLRDCISKSNGFSPNYEITINLGPTDWLSRQHGGNWCTPSQQIYPHTVLSKKVEYKKEPKNMEAENRKKVLIVTEGPS